MRKFYRKFSNNNGENGFTLIEIILSIAILSIVIIAGSRYYINSIQFVHQSGIRSQALLIARNTVEEMKAEAVANWDNLNVIADNFEDAAFSKDDDDIFSSLDLLSNNYIITITFSQTDIDGDGSNDTDLREITVNVSWGTDDIELKSLIAKR